MHRLLLYYIVGKKTVCEKSNMSEFTIFIKLGENDLYEDSEVRIQFVKSSEAPQQDMTNIVSPDYIHITHYIYKIKW